MHVSSPCPDLGDCESYPLEELKKRNAILENIVKQRTAELEKANADLSRLNELKDQVFSIIAHDLRGHFGSIIDLILDETALDPSEIKNLLSDFNVSFKSTYLLLENLLEWSRSQISDEKTEPAVFSMEEMVSDLEKVYAQQIIGKNIDLIVGGSGDGTVKGDYNMTYLIVRNLISNAIKFVNINGKIRVDYKSMNNFLSIRITDNGIGIPREKLDVIFEVNNKKCSSGTAGETGTGLGLYICKEALGRNGGNLEIRSEEGKGTEIDVMIPLSGE